MITINTANPHRPSCRFRFSFLPRGSGSPRLRQASVEHTTSVPRRRRWDRGPCRRTKRGEQAPCGDLPHILLVSKMVFSTENQGMAPENPMVGVDGFSYWNSPFLRGHVQVRNQLLTTMSHQVRFQENRLNNKLSTDIFGLRW